MSNNNLEIETFEVYPDEQPTNNQQSEKEIKNKKTKEPKTDRKNKVIFKEEKSSFLDKLSNLSTMNAIILGLVLVILFIVFDIMMSM